VPVTAAQPLPVKAPLWQALRTSDPRNNNGFSFGYAGWGRSTRREAEPPRLERQRESGVPRVRALEEMARVHERREVPITLMSSRWIAS
jgi:hypothetical protein